MVIVQDTREQKPLNFDGIEGVEKVEKMALSFGDYTAIVHGRPAPILFERKSLADLWGTMVGDYPRFKKEMQRASESNMKLILIVEANYTDVWNGFERSEFSGESMHKKLHTLFVKYDLPTWFCESRQVMARQIAGTLHAIERNFS